MTRAIALVVLVLTARATAQPVAPCDACTRGQAVIDRYGLAAIRPLAPRLARLAISTPATPDQYAAIVDLRKHQPQLGRLGALDDTDLALVAAALCEHPDNQCTEKTYLALLCLADACEIALPLDPKQPDLVGVTPECRPSRIQRPSPRIGLGFDWGNGVERSRFPNDGSAWSIGVDARFRIGRRLGVVARADRTKGRDEATDMDGDGRDDMATGSITRFTTLAGPSFVLDSTRLERTTRFLRLDLLAGYMTTSSQPGESGFAAGFDLSYQLAVFRLGVRGVQGFFGDAEGAAFLLGHLGLAVGGMPPHTDRNTNCSPKRRSSPLALGLELPLGGYGVSDQLGYLATGLGIEMAWHLSQTFDALAHADLLLFPISEADRVMHTAVLAGMRFDHSPRPRRRGHGGLFTTLMAGYTHGAALANTTAGSGPVLDLSVAYGGQDSETAGYLRLHGRFGISPDNSDYRAFFLSAGFELRFDSRRWRDRDRW